MDHLEQQQLDPKTEPILDARTEPAVPATHIQAPQQAMPPPDDLPSWLQPASNEPAPVGRWGRPLVAWGTTLAATAVMVAIGLWLGDHQETQNSLDVVASSQAAATATALPPEAGTGAQPPPAPKRDIGLPALVLLPEQAGEQRPAAPVPALTPAAQQAVPAVPPAQAAPQPPRKITAVANAQSKQKVRSKVVASPRKPVSKRRNEPMLASVNRPRASAGMPQASRDRVAVEDTAPRMRCRRGELARECLARYQ